MKLKFGRMNGTFGGRCIGITYDECYDCEIWGLVFWNRGIFLVID